MAVFLPSGPPIGAALLRIYNISDALRRLGWRTSVVPWRLTLSARRRFLLAASPDVVVMQGARHELNRPAYYPGFPIVYDMDDADFHLDRFRRPVLEAMDQVAAVIAGSRYVADWALGQGAPSAEVVWTGSPVSDRLRPPQPGRPPIIAWAQTRPMTYTREADFVAGVMRDVAECHPGTVLRLYDQRSQDDPSFLEKFRAPGLRVDWFPAAPYAAFLESFDDVSVGLAPLSQETPFSRGKSFGKVLAYLDANVPVVASNACEHPQFFRAGIGVVSNDADEWRRQILRLLRDPERRQKMSDRARAAFRDRLSVSCAARRVEGILSTALKGKHRVLSDKAC